MTEAIMVVLLALGVLAVTLGITVDVVQRRERRRADTELTEARRLAGERLAELMEARMFADEFKRRLEEQTPHPSWLDAVTRRRLLVQTTDGQTIDGPLIRVDADGIVIGPARHADSGQALAGEVWIPRAKVAWVQQPQSANSDG